MADESRSVDPEELLAHTPWLRGLARGLVQDDATADDLVQQACTAALEKSPRDPAALGGWLARVVRNLAARRHRDALRRTHREGRVARSEATGPDLEELVERAEILRIVMDAVLELDEPYRSTVLLRYHEELTPEQVARRLGIPVATVGTRLHRALARLRTRLDRDGGGRKAWVALLAPWAGLATAAGVAAGATGAASGSGVGSGGGATGTAVGAATGSTLSATGTQALFGGIVVMQKSIVATVAAGAVCAAIGFGVGRGTAPPAEPAEGERIVASADYEALVRGDEEARETIAGLREERATLVADLESSTERARRAEEALAAVPAPDEPAPPGTSGLSMAVSYGAWGDLPEFRDADWRELGSAVTAINDLVLPLVNDLEEGRPVSAAVQMDIQEQNQKLVRHGVKILEKVPSNAPMAVNGEFTHPVNLINLIAAMLDTAGVPLSPAQAQQISAIGAVYDQEFAALDSGYDDTTWELTKIVDELSLKRDTMLEVENRLTAEQLAIVAIPKIQNRMRLDTLSPVNMVILNVSPLVMDDRAQLRERVAGALAEGYGIPVEEIAAQADLLDRYETEVDMVLEPVQRETAQFIHLDDIVIGGRAMERLLQDLAPRLTLDEETHLSFASTQGWGVPVVAPASQAGEPEETENP